MDHLILLTLVSATQPIQIRADAIVAIAEAKDHHAIVWVVAQEAPFHVLERFDYVVEQWKAKA